MITQAGIDYLYSLPVSELLDLMKEVTEVVNERKRVSIGMELTADEQENYKTAIDEYVQAAEDYALQNQYAVSLNLSLALDGADADTLAIGDKVNAFYQSSYQDMVNLGDELSKAVNDAFADGVLDPNEIENLADIQRKMAELQEGIAQGEFTAKLSAIQLKYDGSNLTADSFKNIGGKTKSEFLGAGNASITLPIFLSSMHGVRPRVTLERIADAVERGEYYPLVIGGRSVGRNKWRITCASETWDTIIRDGILVEANVTLNLEEYV